MDLINHKNQLKAWEKEHKKPQLLEKIGGMEASGGLKKFYYWLKNNYPAQNLKAVEMACGKGRNVIWLAEQGVETLGVDFSPTAIREAIERAKKLNISKSTRFIVHDATEPYLLDPDSYDFAIDCFGSTDIETAELRKKAIAYLAELIKPGGYLFSYLVAATGDYYEEMSKHNPGKEKYTYLHRIGKKFEKNFDREEVINNYPGLKPIVIKFLNKNISIGDEKLSGQLIWSVFQKP